MFCFINTLSIHFSLFNVLFNLYNERFVEKFFFLFYKINKSWFELRTVNSNNDKFNTEI
jgi:hypothetical protein